MLEKYTDLYDFAPVGYFTLDTQGRIKEVNLTGASLLGTERSRLINQRLSRSLTPASHADFLRFLGRIFAGSGQQACEVTVITENSSFFCANIHGTLLVSSDGQQKSCRVVVSDISAHKQAEEAQHRLEALAASILTLEQEIAQRKETEGSLKKKGRQHVQLLARSRQMEERLRQFSHQIMSAQDDEHRQISKELYAVISQALAGINIRLVTIQMEAAVDTTDLDSKINSMKRIVKDSMGLVDRFSRKFHPTSLDDLGLVPTLRSYAQAFTKKTRIDVQLHTIPEVERMSAEKRIAFYHVVREALANMNRHTHANRVGIAFNKTDSDARMIITYNGSSFHNETRSRAKKREELELLGMNERLKMVGGGLVMESTRGFGTTITACIPFDTTAQPLLEEANSPSFDQ